MKILHVNPMYVPAVGGAEVHVKELSEELVRRGHQVTVLTTNVRTNWDLYPGIHGGLPETETINGVDVRRVRADGGSWGRLFGASQRARGGYRLLRTLLSDDGAEMLYEQPRAVGLIPAILTSGADIVTSFNWYLSPAYYAYLARRLKRFIWVGLPLFHTAEPWCSRAIYPRMLARADAMVVNTAFEADFVRARGARRAVVAGVGVRPHHFAVRDGSRIRVRYGLGTAPVVGFVGRQTAKKGALRLLRAMQIVWRTIPQARLLLAGPRPPQRTDVDAFIDELSGPEQSRIVRVDEFPDAEKASMYEALDVLALPSTEESFGLTYLEAWMCGKPVIGLRIGAIQCVIDHEQDGLLVERDRSDELAAAIGRLLTDRELARRLGERGQAKTIERHSWEKVASTVEELYRELIDVSERGLPGEDARRAPHSDAWVGARRAKIGSP